MRLYWEALGGTRTALIGAAVVCAFVIGSLVAAAWTSSRDHSTTRLPGESEYRGIIRAALQGTGGKGACALIEGRSPTELIDALSPGDGFTASEKQRAGEIVLEECERID